MAKYEGSGGFNPMRYVSIIAVFFILLVSGCSCVYVVKPGERGVLVTLGKVDKDAKPEGLGFKAPLISSLKRVSIQQQTKSLLAPCYSSDLQQIDLTVKVLYRIPESQVVDIYTNYSGDPFESLILPRIQEAMKENTAMHSAETIVKKREDIKRAALASAIAKVGSLITINDLVIENLDLSDQLEQAIEAKMVQEQEAAKAQFTKQKALIDAETMEIEAKGKAKAIEIEAQAISKNRDVISLRIVEKWNGVSPQVVSGSGGANILLPLNK